MRVDCLYTLVSFVYFEANIYIKFLQLFHTLKLYNPATTKYLIQSSSLLIKAMYSMAISIQDAWSLLARQI